jgi:hypothetical protein
MPLRMISVVGYQPQLTALWDGCSTGAGRLHAARHATTPPVPAGQGEPALPDPTRGWTGACESCGAAVPWEDDEVRLGGGIRTLWSTESGAPEPGDLYWSEDYQGRCFQWDNCDGQHLHAVLPNGHPWNIDSRARNCDRPADRLHRCWVRTGELPRITVGKGGNTCSAGAGSIASGDYHGFLVDGVLVPV